MTRTELEQIHDLKKELKMWQEKLRKMEARMGAGAITAEATGVHSTGISDKTGNLAADMADVEEIIQRLVCIISRSIKDIENHISSIEDSRLRQIVEYRCVRGYTWIQIGHKMGTTADSCRMTFNRAYPR